MDHARLLRALQAPVTPNANTRLVIARVNGDDDPTTATNHHPTTIPPPPLRMPTTNTPKRMKRPKALSLSPLGENPNALPPLSPHYSLVQPSIYAVKKEESVSPFGNSTFGSSSKRDKGRAHMSALAAARAQLAAQAAKEKRPTPKMLTETKTTHEPEDKKRPTPKKETETTTTHEPEHKVEDSLVTSSMKVGLKGIVTSIGDKWKVYDFEELQRYAEILKIQKGSHSTKLEEEIYLKQKVGKVHDFYMSQEEATIKEPEIEMDNEENILETEGKTLEEDEKESKEEQPSIEDEENQSMEDEDDSTSLDEQEEEDDEEETEESKIEIQEPSNDRCQVCTLPLDHCQCAPTTTPVAQSTTSSLADAPKFGLLPKCDLCLRTLNSFDPDDETKRSLTLSPYVTVFLFSRLLLRAIACVYLSLDINMIETYTIHHSNNQTRSMTTPNTTLCVSPDPTLDINCIDVGNGMNCHTCENNGYGNAQECRAEMDSAGKQCKFITTLSLPIWSFYPAQSLSTVTPLSFRPPIALLYEIAVVYFVLLQFNRKSTNRNTLRYLWCRPILGLATTAVLVFDAFSCVSLLEYLETFITQHAAVDTDTSLVHAVLYETNAFSAYSESPTLHSMLITTGVFLFFLLANNCIVWMIAAHVVLAHDRSADGDTDGTDRQGETGGGGAAGTGISSYRQQQLVFVRNALWTMAPLPPHTPVPLRVYLLLLTGCCSSIVASLIFVNQAWPLVYYHQDDHELPTMNNATDTTTTMHWDDPLLILLASVLMGVVSTLIALKKTTDIYLTRLHHLRTGAVKFQASSSTSNNNNNVDVLHDVLPGVFSSGLLGWSLGFHLGTQLVVSSGVAVLYKMVSLVVSAYQTVPSSAFVVVPSLLLMLDCLIMALVSFSIIYVVEHHVIGTHRCLRPRHLNSCIELLGLVLYGLCSFAFGLLYILACAVLHFNIVLGPLLLDTSSFVKQIMYKSAETYEQANNPILRFSAALMKKTSIAIGRNGSSTTGGGSNNAINWDQDFLQSELNLSKQEKITNRALRLFFFLIENPGLIDTHMQWRETKESVQVFDDDYNVLLPSSISTAKDKEQQRLKQWLVSYANVLLPVQVQALQVAFDLWDSNNDGVVSYRDLRCSTTTVPELNGLKRHQLENIMNHISMESHYDLQEDEDEGVEESRAEETGWMSSIAQDLKDLSTRKKTPNRKTRKGLSFTLPEWLSFIRHRLFLCDFNHATNNDVQSYGIQLRKLRGQLKSSLKLKRIKSQEFERSNSMIKGLSTSPSQQKLDNLKKHEERVSNKAIALCSTISNTELAFWSSKLSPGDLEEIVQRLRGSATATKAQEGTTKGAENGGSGGEVLDVKKIRSLVAICLGNKINIQVGDLMMDALQDGGSTATRESIRHCYVMCHATGCRVMRRRVDGGDGGDGGSGEEQESHPYDHDEHAPAIMKRNRKEMYNRNSNRTKEHTNNDATNYMNSIEAVKPMRKSAKLKALDELSSQLSPTGKKKPLRLGKEKQLLGFVSRSLLPHSF